MEQYRHRLDFLWSLIFGSETLIKSDISSLYRLLCVYLILTVFDTNRSHQHCQVIFFLYLYSVRCDILEFINTSMAPSTSLSSLPYGTVLNISCDPGYQLLNGGREISIICSMAGIWNVTIPNNSIAYDRVVQCSEIPGQFKQFAESFVDGLFLSLYIITSFLYCHSV